MTTRPASSSRSSSALTQRPVTAGWTRRSRWGGAFTVRHDLQPGAELTVSIADADGEVIATGVAAVASVGFVPITNDGDVVGTTRVHKAKLT